MCFGRHVAGTHAAPPHTHTHLTQRTRVVPPGLCGKTRPSLLILLCLSICVSFTQVTKPIQPGQPLLGDYGNSYWQAGEPRPPADAGADDEGEWRQLREELALSAQMRRLMHALRGRNAAFPIKCDGIVDTDDDGE